jgi:two-component system, LuxR family, response regulator FixJ
MTDIERTVHVVDDDPAMRDSLRMLLASAGFAVRTHDSAEAFLAEVPPAMGCVLTDVRMPKVSGIELQRRLRSQGSLLPVIVMTGQGDIAIAVQAMKAGAVDFLEKPFSEDALFGALTRAIAESKKLREVGAAFEQATARLAALTPREREVLDLLAIGQPNKAIARELGVSPRTIEVHRARVMEKLQAHNLPDLVRLTLAADAGKQAASDPAILGTTAGETLSGVNGASR